MKLFVLTVLLAAAYANPEIGFGSFQKPHPKDVSPKVVGGSNAALGNIPYQVSLQIAGPTNSQHYCGGALITPSTAVTTGTCVTDVPLKPWQHLSLRAGLVSFDTPGVQQQKRRVNSTIVHPDFAGGLGPYDIALLIVDEPFNMGLFANAIKLPSETQSGPAVLSGWGSTSTTNEPDFPEHLKSVNVDILSHDECVAALADLDTPFDDSMICTGPLDGGVSACSGDAGGPLVTGKGANRVLAGIVSWGPKPCGQEGMPTVYTDVSKYMDFIDKNKV